MTGVRPRSFPTFRDRCIICPPMTFRVTRIRRSTAWSLLAVGAAGVLSAAALPAYLANHAPSEAGLRSAVWGFLIAAAAPLLVLALREARRRLPPRRFAGVAAGTALLLALLLRWRLRETSAASFGVLAAVLAVAAIHLALVAAGGSAILRALGVRSTRLSWAVLSLLAGWTLWGTAAYLLGLAGLFSPLWLAALSASFGLLGRQDLRLAGASLRRRRPVIPGRSPAGLILLCLLAGLFLIAGLLAPNRSASPPIAFDETMYHLAMPKHYLEVGAIDFYPNIRGAYIPALSQMHYALFIGIGLDAGAKFAALGLSLALIAAAFETGRAAAGKLAGALAASFVALTPLVVSLAGTAYTDTACAALGLAAFLCALEGIRRGRRGMLPLSGILIGGALFTRSQAVFQAAALAVACLAAAIPVLRRRGWPLARGLLLAGALGLAIPLPFWLHNAWFTGNPVYPLLDHVFPSRGWSNAADLETFNRTNMRAFGLGRSLLDLLALPWRLVIREGSFDAGGGHALGLMALAALPLALRGSFRRRNLPFALGALVLVLTWFWSMQVVRYLLPALSLGAVLAAAGLVPALGRRPLIPLAAAAAAGCLLLGMQAGKFIAERDLALAGRDRDLYLDARLPTHRALREGVSRLPAGAVIWAFMDQQAVYYYPRTVIGDFFGPNKYPLIARSFSPFSFRDGKEVMARLESWGATHILLNLLAVPGIHPRPGTEERDGLLFLKDPVLRDRLDLLFADQDVFLFRLAPPSGLADPPPGVALGENVIRDPSFQALGSGPEGGWGIQGKPGVVAETGGSGPESALRTDSGAPAFQVFPAEPGAMYRFACRARSESGEPAPLRVHVQWLAGKRRRDGSSVAVLETGREYREETAVFTAPLEAVRAVLVLCGHLPSWVRVTNVALRKIERRRDGP